MSNVLKGKRKMMSKTDSCKSSSSPGKNTQLQVKVLYSKPHLSKRQKGFIHAPIQVSVSFHSFNL